jgi:hypothetical protein
MKKELVTIILLAIVTTLITGGAVISTNMVQQADAGKSKVYCGPKLETGGLICAGGTNQELKDYCKETSQDCHNVKQTCKVINEGATDGKCTKLK